MVGRGITDIVKQFGVRNTSEDTKKRIIFHIIIGIIAIITLGLGFILRAYLFQSREYTFDSVSEMRYGASGGTLVIDNSKKTLLVMNDEDVITARYEGGSENAYFFYAAHAAQTTDGSVYVADITYGNRGNLLDSERIIKISGARGETVYEINYLDAVGSTGSVYASTSGTPLQYGNIRELQAYGDDIYFIYANDESLTVYRIAGGAADGSAAGGSSESPAATGSSGDTAASSAKELSRQWAAGEGAAEAVLTVPISGRLNDASYDASTGALALAYRTGELILRRADGTEAEILAGEKMVPWDLSAKNGRVFFTEVVGLYIGSFAEDAPETVSRYAETGDILYKLDASADGKNVLATDYLGFYRFTGDGVVSTASEYLEGAPIAYFAAVIGVWALIGFGILCAVLLIARLAIDYFFLILNSEQAMRVLFIIVASLTVAFFLSYSLLSEIMDTSTDASERQIEVFSDLLIANIDGDEIAKLDEPADYMNAEYKDIKRRLDKYIGKTYVEGEYYYYVIYSMTDTAIAMVMDYEDTMSILTPVYGAEDEPYASVINDGESVSYSENSAYGAWTFVLTPIYDSAGNVIAELEVGQSLDAINARRGELIQELVVNVATCTLVVAMLMLEIAFLFGFLEKKRNTAPELLDPTETVPVRSLMFFSYVADSMQDTFIAVLCSDLYDGFLPLSDGVAAALPISAQLFMMAAVSAIAGKITEAQGTRRTLIAGMLTQLLGFIVCLVGGSYMALLIGKMMIGIGMGDIYVCCNTAASTARSDEKAGEAFAGVTAGTLSGITIGAGLASVLLSMGGWRLIYLVGAMILVMGLLVAVYSADIHPGREAGDISVQKDIGIVRFFINKRVLPFFLMILVPFMMSLSYREYFFPLFAAENGFDEVGVGRVYLFCGVVVIYIGPVLSAKLLERLGAFKSVVTASFGLAAAMLLFVIYPSIVTVIIGIVMLSIVISFAYTVQYTFFEKLPECLAFGEGNSLGIYSVFESLGQTIGPVAYGAVLAFGFREGVAIAGGTLLVLAIIYTALTRRMGEVLSS